MSSIVVIGAQWGDEGKGKLVDCLTARADWVVRFQGGNNAGHTLVVDGKKTKLNLVPSGILRAHSRCLIGSGVVVNPAVLIQELANLRAAGIEVGPERLMIDRDAQLILEYHPLIDAARESRLGAKKIGTTGRGIGPVYEDRAARRGVRFAELLKLDGTKETLSQLVYEKNLYLKEVLASDAKVDFEKMWKELCGFAAVLSPFIGNGSLEIYKALRSGAKVVFEGAQASMLDISFGTVPFVTACSTIAGAVSTGCGIGPKEIGYVLGVAKAYCTRVGGGPFPTELADPIGDAIRERGAEYGTVTGRPRRCGWFDAVALRRAVRLNGFDSLAITKLDVLSDLSRIKIGAQYRLDGHVLEDVPALSSDLERVEVVFEELDGWQCDISSARRLSDLPAPAQRFVRRISDLTGCPVSVVGVGADRNSIIVDGQCDYLKSYL